MMPCPIPLEPYFFEIFAANEVIDWKPKDFWTRLNFDNEPNKNELRNKLYIGLKKLVQRGYLNSRIDVGYSSIKLYTATDKANALKKSMPISENSTKKILEAEYYSLTNELVKKRIELKYCNKLKNAHGHLINQLNLKHNILKKSIFELEIQKNFLSDFLKF